MRHATPTNSDPLSLIQLLRQRYLRLLHETSMSEATFSADVRAEYERLVPAGSRSIEWSTNPDPVKRMRRDAEKISRWFDEDVQARFPLEAFEAFVMAFPEPLRLALWQEIAARSRLLVWPMPFGGSTEDCAELGALCKEAGEAIQAVSGLLDDGKIDSHDRHSASAALTEIDEAMAALIAMRERIERQALRRRCADRTLEPSPPLRSVKHGR